MKKIFFTVFVLQFSITVFGQTLLSSHHLELKKPNSSQQLLNAVNSKSQVFAFASDKEKVTVFKYNQALFFSDSLSANRPDKEYKFMAGYSFAENGNPYLYWASEDFAKVQSVYFDFVNKINAVAMFQLPFKDETILNSFSENNSFYILSLLEKEDKLKFYVFNDGKLTEKTVDFSTYKFTNELEKPRNFNALIAESAIEMLGTKTLNPLFQSVGKSKMYLTGNRMVLTFDSATKTQILEIDLDTFNVSEKIIPQQILAKSGGRSNSYFHQDKLYQLKASDEELAIAAVDLKTGNVIKKHAATLNDTISFRNSPLFSQTGNQKGRELKNTKKFLQRLDNSDVGLSVYKTPNALMVTVGGVRNVSSTGGILVGIGAGVAMVATGSGADMTQLFGDQDLQSNYFEALFDDKFEHQNLQQEGLAVDFISQFLGENEVPLQSVFPYKNYYILGYYDSKKKEYVMRKFEDVSIN